MLYCHFQDEEPFPRSVLRLLWERHPEVREAFEARGLFVIEFQVGDVCVLDPAVLEDAGARAREAYATCSLGDDTRAVLFVAHARIEVARGLAASGLEVPGGTFLGACGYAEGGMGFWGADGTVIESDDWSAARDFALDVAERFGSGARGGPFAEGGPASRPRDAIAEVDRLLQDALDRGASDAYFQPGSNGAVTARFRVDGLLQELPVSAAADLVINRLKILARFDIAEHRQPQMGAIDLSHLSGGARAWAATTPTRDGEDVVLRFEHPTRAPGLSELGLTAAHLEQIDAVLRHAGLVIVAGPARSGRGTLLHSLLAELDLSALVAYAVAHHHEHLVPGARRIELSEARELRTEHAVAHCVAMRADVILAGILSSPAAIDAALRGAMDIRLLLAGLHAPSAATAIRRLLDAAPGRALQLASSLNAVLAVRLVPRLCLRCREAYAPSPEERATLERLAGAAAWERWRAPSDQPLYRRRGCSACGGRGYLGRVGLQEVLVPSAALRSRVAEGAAEADIAAQAAADGLTTLAEDGLRKALEGTTDVAQVVLALEA